MLKMFALVLYIQSSLRPLRALKERLRAYLFLLVGPSIIQKGYDNV